MDGFDIVEHADGVVYAEVDLRDGLAGAVAFDGEAVGEAGLILRGGASDLRGEIFELGAEFGEGLLGSFSGRAGGVVIKRGAVGVLRIVSGRP